MIMGKEREADGRSLGKALIMIFLIGCLSVPVIGGIELVRVSGARATSDEGWIVFVRVMHGIWIVDTDGKNEKQLTNRVGDYDPRWSPDGRHIAFRRWNGEDFDIYTMDAQGANTKLLTNLEGDRSFQFPLVWSPDGRQIAFTRRIWEEKGGKRELESSSIYVMDSDGVDLRRLMDSPQGVNIEVSDWSPDGSKIAMIFRPRNQIWIMDADGRNAKMICDSGQTPAWSPDGKQIVFERLEGGRLGIYVMDADGSNIKRLTEPGLGWSLDWRPRWSPDGKKIVFVSDRNAPADIYVMNADGSNVYQLTDTLEREEYPDWTASLYAVEPAGKLPTTWAEIKSD